MELKEQLTDIVSKKEQLDLEEKSLLEKAFTSGKADDAIFAKAYMERREGVLGNSKSYIFDPATVLEAFGYKSSPRKVSYTLLRQMAKEPIIKSIINTRTEQVSGFSRFQEDVKKNGWNIRKKKERFSKNPIELSDSDKQEIENIVSFIENCGKRKLLYFGDTFNSFLKKIVPDSLILDQLCFEVTYSVVGTPLEYFAVDGGTMRLSETYMNCSAKEEDLVNGYAPFYVQLKDGVVNSEFYPWEMCFGIRNPSTNIYNNGYGESELEGMVQIITWLLWSESFNASQFKNGSFPKGLLQAKGLTRDNLEGFRQQWSAQLKGYSKAGSIPILGADEVNWIPMGYNNQEMEYGRWIEFLVRIACAHYKIAPEEIGFNLSGGQNNMIYEGNAEYKLEYSQDKGLVPLLKFIEDIFNKYVVFPLSKGEWEFYFTGIEIEEEEKGLTLDIQRLQLETFNEVRARKLLPPLPFGDIPANPAYLQYMQMKQQQQMMQQQQGGQFGGGGEGEENYDTNKVFNNPFSSEESVKENPFAQDLVKFLQSQ